MRALVFLEASVKILTGSEVADEFELTLVHGRGRLCLLLAVNGGVIAGAGVATVTVAGALAGHAGLERGAW